MSKGVLLFANNNLRIDYIKQAAFCASRIKKYMNLPVAIATDNVECAKSFEFEYYIQTDSPKYTQNKFFYNGVYNSTTLQWSNHSRFECYNITPFDKTLVMDTDYIVSNDVLLNSFKIDADLMMYKSICDVGLDRNNKEFDYITETSIPMWWATVFYFKKTAQTKMFFDLVAHIKEEWNYYRLSYQIANRNFRNDFAFSIAAHILSGLNEQTFVKELPGKFWFTSDRDIPLSIDNETIRFLIDQNENANYIAAKIKDSNVHIMNKFALQELIKNV
jgi:hypothetical protein